MMGLRGRRMSQRLVDMSQQNHSALHTELNRYMANNCTKCIPGFGDAHAGFALNNSGEKIRLHFSVDEIFGCLQNFFDAEGG